MQVDGLVVACDASELKEVQALADTVYAYGTQWCLLLYSVKSAVMHVTAEGAQCQKVASCET